MKRFKFHLLVPNTAERVPVVLVVVVRRIHVRTVEVQVVRVVVIVVRTTPIVGVGTLVVERAGVGVATIDRQSTQKVSALNN